LGSRLAGGGQDINGGVQVDLAAGKSGIGHSSPSDGIWEGVTLDICGRPSFVRAAHCIADLRGHAG